MAYRILVVDDERDIVQMLRDLFTRKGYQVLCACQAQEALALCAQQPDLILLDVNMPDMDGFACAGRSGTLSAVPFCFSPPGWRTRTSSRALPPEGTTTF